MKVVSSARKMTEIFFRAGMKTIHFMFLLTVFG
jgi:hypothetical protein